MKPSYESVSAYVDLKPVLKCDVCASYALATVFTPIEMDGQIRFAVYGMAKLWVNEEQVFSKKKMTPFQVDGDVVTAKLQKGSNRILLKVVAQGIQNGFILRMTDLKGQPLSNLKVLDLMYKSQKNEGFPLAERDESQKERRENHEGAK